jgi:hypothetical protein
LLDEFGDLGHDIDTVEPLAERTFDKSFNRLTAGISAVP